MKTAWALGAAVVVEVLAAALVFTHLEHFTFPLAVYFAVETATTVGYGDVTPHSGAGHVAAVVMMLTVIPTLGTLFGRLSAVHTIRMWHKKNGAALESAAKAHRIAADLYRAHTGEDHPEAP